MTDRGYVPSAGFAGPVTARAHVGDFVRMRAWRYTAGDWLAFAFSFALSVVVVLIAAAGLVYA